jgi:hypothetical protein
MRCTVLIVTLVFALVVPGFAAANAALPYDLRLSAPLGPLPSTVGVRAGSTFGGVPVTGTVSGTTASGNVSLFTDGRLFASGAYACNSACTFSGTIAGKSVMGMTLTTSRSGFTASAFTVTGKAVSGAFPNHGAWVSAVSNWANDNLSSVQRGRIVSAAARIEGPLASGKSDPDRAGGHGSGPAIGHDSGNAPGQGNGGGGTSNGHDGGPEGGQGGSHEGRHG